jgi:hypothetical protein
LLSAVLGRFVSGCLGGILGRFGAVLGHARLLLMLAFVAERLVARHVSGGFLPTAHQLVQK